MKRLSVLAMAMIVMASCAKENVQPNNEPTGEKALLEIGLASTKTQLGEEDKVNKLFPIVWSDGDEIAVIENMGVKGKQNVSVYRLKEGAGTANGVFEHVSGDAFPKVITDVVYPASAVMPKGTLISEIPIVDVSSLVPKDQTQSYEEGNFDKNAAVMHFHRNNASEKIVLKPLSSIICIPIKGFDDNDVVTAVKWQNMDDRTATVTLNCPNGVTLSKDQATNFYLSIQPMLKNCNGIAYVYLKNGAIQVQTPRNLKAFQAGTLHRFPEWTLSKKAKWTILGIGSQRDIYPELKDVKADGYDYVVACHNADDEREVVVWCYGDGGVTKIDESLSEDEFKEMYLKVIKDWDDTTYFHHLKEIADDDVKLKKVYRDAQNWERTKHVSTHDALYSLIGRGKV